MLKIVIQMNLITYKTIFVNFLFIFSLFLVIFDFFGITRTIQMLKKQKSEGFEHILGLAREYVLLDPNPVTKNEIQVRFQVEFFFLFGKTFFEVNK